jgi:hypothetical protein
MYARLHVAKGRTAGLHAFAVPGRDNCLPQSVSSVYVPGAELEGRKRRERER